MTPDHVGTCPRTEEACDRGCVASWCSIRGTFDPPRPEHPPLPPEPGWLSILLGFLRATVQHRTHEEPRT